MKKYIGRKHIEAEPMTMGEAYLKNLLQSGRIPDESETDKAGYHVKYGDGHESWLPADLFEKAYKRAETPLDRMTIEENELVDSLEKLYGFINGEKFNELDNTTRGLLTAQYKSMVEYLHALRLRETKMKSGNGTCSAMSFGSAIALLNKGFALRRSGWNGKSLFVIKQVPAHIESEIIPNSQSLPQSAKNLILEGKRFINYNNQCLIYNRGTGIADSWVPSISDIFSEDWEIVE